MQNIAAMERWFEINISSMGIETQEPVSLLHLFLVILKVQPILVSPTDTANENRNMTDFKYVKRDLSGSEGLPEDDREDPNILIFLNFIFN